MPDIGGFGRGLLKGALSATEKAAEKVKDAAESASRKMTDDDDAETTQVISNATTQAADDADPDATQVVSSSTTRAAQDGPPSASAHPDRQARPGGPNPGGPNPGHPNGPGRPGFPPGPGRPGGPGPMGGPGDPAGPPRPGWPQGGPTPPGGMPAPHGGSSANQEHAPHSGLLPSPGPALMPNRGPATPPGGLATPGGLANPPGGTPAPLGAQPGPAPDRGPATPPGGVPAADGAAQFADPVGEPTLADEPEDHADESEVRELMAILQELITKRRPPAGPIQGEWSIGVGDLLGASDLVPKRVRGLVSRLNRFGGLSYSPQEIVFDGEEVPWEKVTEIRTRNIIDYLVGDAVQQQVESLPLPWFPGRKRVLDGLGQAILTLTIATAKDQIEKVEFDVRVPAEIEYKASFGRKKELNAGVLSALVLVDPAVKASVIATAQARGVTVTDSGEDMLASATERAIKIREKVAALEAELEKFKKRFGRSG